MNGKINILQKLISMLVKILIQWFWQADTKMHTEKKEPIYDMGAHYMTFNYEYNIGIGMYKSSNKTE